MSPHATDPDASTSHTDYPSYTSPISQRLPTQGPGHSPHRFREFELNGRVFVVTGGAQGLGLAFVEALVEAGGIVYCLDRQKEPTASFSETQGRVAAEFGGTLHYRQVDVQDAKLLDEVIASIAEEHSRLDGLIANAGIQYTKPALEYPADEVSRVRIIKTMEFEIALILLSDDERQLQRCLLLGRELYVHLTVFTMVSANVIEGAKQMIKYKTPGNMVLIGSMSGFNANKGLLSSVYNASKAAVIQLGRNLSMEWARAVDGKPIRVNVLCPGNIITPMVENDFKNDPSLRKTWEDANMLGRISEPKEYRGAILFLLSDASSFMTAGSLVIDGGYTAW
ncbi:hypothetical protein LTR56_004480 [Elasticomyces elasticus]|nr:hypothetical protein LTR56_004480 [Elasticomyces elasticus]KAK3654213.1 hypothetical protein LTR22_010839 [Elasticomyces elasticus]KAK4920013.1 hypothetical protein LTR49_012451 [Elasticomyces elasticus]KAK5758847.1 hypothetical protein LTS12_011088 [Elasticomyces elasticus]